NVVHLSGTETITGSKQFTVAPTVPTPTQSGQAVTKAYVDAFVANVGNGNFVSKTGDIMSGPLTLPADPTAPNQASTKHYMDLSTPGAKTISLASCAPGVTGSEQKYYVYISGTGTPEALLVTGGTCAGNNAPGTLQFTTANAHASEYIVTSASGGLQEALIAA